MLMIMWVKIKEEVFCLRAYIKALSRTELAQCCSTTASETLLAELKGDLLDLL